MKFASLLRYKTVFISLFILTLFYLFAWAGLPRVLLWQAEKQVQERSGHALNMDLPEINPFKLTLRIPNLRLSSPKGEQIVAFDELFVDLSGTDLFTGLIALDQINLKNLNLKAALLPEGKNNFTDLINAFKSNDPEDENSTPPAFLLSHLNIANATLDLEDRRTSDGFKTHFESINLELHDLATQSDQNGDFVLNALTGLDAELKIRAKIQLSDPSATGELSLTGLNLAKLQAVLKPLLPTAPPTGKLNLALNFDVNLQNETTKPTQPKVVLSNINTEIREFTLNAKPQGATATALFSKLNIHNAHFDLQTNQVDWASFTLSGLQLNHPNKTKALGLDTIEVGPVSINLSGQHAQVGKTTIQGGQLNIKRSASGDLDLISTLNDWAPKNQKSAPTAPSSPWTYTVNSVELSGINANLQDQSIKPTLNLGFNNISASSREISQDLSRTLPLEASLSLQSGGNISINGHLNPSTAAAQFNVEINALALIPAQPFIAQFAKLELVSGAVSSKGKAIYNDKEQSYSGNFTLAGLRLNEMGSKNSFLQLKRLATPSLLANVKGLNIQRLTLEGLDTALLISKNKSTNISRILVAQGDTKKTTNAQTLAKPPFAVRIDRLNLSGSKLLFSDESLFIPFGTRIHSLEGVVNSLSNKPGTRGELVLKGTVDEYGEANAQGTVNLLEPTAFMDIAVKFRNIEMRNLTAYSGTFANRKIESGKLTMNLNYQIENQQLNSTNQVIVDQLKLGERVQSPQGRDLPLELAIAILQDSNGRIDLGLPITGNLNDPEFSYGAIVWKAIGNVLTKIVTAPFRALGALFGGGDSEDFGKITFNAGSAMLRPSQQENLQKLGEALSKRPNLAITIQGTWAPADLSSIQNLQMRRALAMQAGEKLQANEDPGPLALSNENTQKAIKTLFNQRFGSATLRDTEKNTAKDNHLYAVLAQKLQDAEQVTPAQLQALATQRQILISEGLKAKGIPSERLKTGAPKEGQATEDNTIPIELGVAVNQ
jgi:outer membrane protein OmpA-like peptidoglycan-associated protein